jgi:hypothetical protein
MKLRVICRVPGLAVDCIQTYRIVKRLIKKQGIPYRILFMNKVNDNMKKSPWLISVLTILCFVSCKKDSQAVTAQTISLLQNKWTLISSNTIFSSNTLFNASYTGAPTDYYLFGSNDSLTIQQAGSVNVPTIPVSVTTTYSFAGNSMLVYGLNSGIQVTIRVLTSNLLVLSNPASITDAGNPAAVLNGIKIDSLKRQ